MGSGAVRIARGVGCGRFDGDDGYIVAFGIWKKLDNGVVVHRWCGFSEHYGGSSGCEHNEMVCMALLDQKSYHENQILESL